MNWIRIYFTALSVFFTLDMIWLGFVARNFYREQIGFMLRSDVNWIAAIAFYLIFVAGLVYFVIARHMAPKDILGAVLSGAFFGLVTYSAYDLTNLALTKNWPLVITFVDLAWGTFLGACVCGFTTFIYGAKV
jgi:uncharacterized membrane protein